jgi:hypothetical protein
MGTREAPGNVFPPQCVEEDVSAVSVVSRRRKLNAFETFFAENNVRFALLVPFEDTKPSLLHLVADIHRSLASSCLGCIQLTQEDGEWYLESFSGAHDVVKVTSFSVAECVHHHSESVRSYLDRRFHSNEVSALGPLSINILQDQVSGQVGLVVNANHALADGRSLVHLVELILNPSTNPELKQPVNSGVAPVPSDWKDLLESCRTRDWNEFPPFLANGANMLTLEELSCPELESRKGDESIRFAIGSHVLSCLKTAIKKYSERVTMTGLLATLIMASIALEYSGEDSNKEVGVSVLVDLRPFLLDSEAPEIPQAHGTVTLSLSCERIQRHNPLKIDSLLNLAVTVTKQLCNRIERGEAHRSALALTSGQFESGSPPSTIELSNLGICNFPISVYTAQRFDGYSGTSCMVHTEDGNGEMKLSISVGDGIDVVLVERVFVRLSSWMKNCDLD